MRDQKRIQAFCNRFARAWETVPDLRFGQIISIVLSDGRGDGFYDEDDKMIERIEKDLRSKVYVPSNTNGPR